MNEIQRYRNALGQILNGAGSLELGVDPIEVVRGVRKIAAAALIGSAVSEIWEINKLADIV